LTGAASLGASPGAVRAVRLICDELEEGVAGVDEARGTARRGVTGVVFPFAAVRLLASVGFRGRGWFGVLRSMGILQVVEWCYVRTVVRMQ
jgi:hypothetical protein